MKKLIELSIVGLSTSYVQKNTCAVILKEKKGGLRLPIVIGIFEAQAIALELENIKPSRPLTHDLFQSFAIKLDFHIERIVITDLNEGVFFAKIECTRNNVEGGDAKFTIDARPSDAIAISLKFNTPILATKKVLELAGLEIESDDSEMRESDDTPSEQEKSEDMTYDEIKSLSLADLRKELKKAVKTENYEFAILLKKEIDERHN